MYLFDIPEVTSSHFPNVSHTESSTNSKKSVMTLHSPVWKNFILHIYYYFIFDCCHMLWLFQLHKNISTRNLQLQKLRWKQDSQAVQHYCMAQAAETANVEMINTGTQTDVFMKQWV
jgi:hypothetical protein